MSFTVSYLGPESIKEEVELDKKVYGEDVEQAFHVDIDTLKEWDLLDYHICLGAKNENGILLGYLAMYHLKEETIKKLINGEIIEDNFQNNDFIEPKQGNELYCYICNFVVKDNNTRIAICLLNKTLKYFRFLSEKGVNVKGLGTTGISEQGKKLCEKLGLRKMRTYEKLPDGTIPKLCVCDFERDVSFSRMVKQIKEIFIENDRYL